MAFDPIDHSATPRRSLSLPWLNRHIQQAFRLGDGGWVSSRVIMLGFGAGIVVSLGAGFWLSQASGEQDSNDAVDPSVPVQESTGAAKAVTVAPVQPAQIRQMIEEELDYDNLPFSYKM